MFASVPTSSAARLAGQRCTRNSLNLGNIIEELLKDYDTHLLPEADGVNVTIELHVQVSYRFINSFVFAKIQKRKSCKTYKYNWPIHAHTTYWSIHGCPRTFKSESQFSGT